MERRNFKRKQNNEEEEEKINEKNNGKSYEFGIIFERAVIIHFHKPRMRLEFIVFLRHTH